MTDDISEKVAAQDEAHSRTEWEHQRIDYYRSLRYNFDICTVDYWTNSLFDNQRAVYRAKRNPSRTQIRKSAEVGFWEDVFAFVSEEKKKEIETKKSIVKKKLQDEVNSINEKELQRCNAYNARLFERIEAKVKRLNEYNVDEAEEYFTYALSCDSFSLDGEEYWINFNLKYDAEKKQLIVDYELPTMDKVSRVKEWKVDKNNNIVSKEMNKTDYLELYEQVLLDLSLRVVGILFESDSNNVLRSVIFNGSCMYNEWQERPTILLSFKMYKKQYSYDHIRSMDCVSKEILSKLNEVRYLENIKNNKAPSDLWEAPPYKRVIPIRSSWS